MVMRKRKKSRRKLKASTILSLRSKKRKYTKRYLQIRNEVLLRDGYKCCMPGCEKPTGVKLIVHHIMKYSTNRALRQNKMNLISICNKCHNGKLNGRESKYETILKIIVRRNLRNYKKDKKTKEEILEAQRAQQQLPEDFTGYEYKDEKDLIRVKADEHYLRKTWRLIKFRTQNKNSSSYKNYGARGIKMYDKWIDNFEEFQKYIAENLGERPEGYSIDRKDNEKGYYPDNLQWASNEEQGQNRRTTVLDECMVGVILILFYKYKWKQSQIMNKFCFNNPTIVRNVVHGNTWTNISKQYVSIINNQKVLDKLNG